MEALSIRKALIHGATLGSVLQSLVAGKRQCDGLIFGSFRTQLQQNFHDDEPEAVTTEEHQACISSAVCCATTCSFYNEAGDINEQELQALLPPAGSTQEPMIGWISYRPGPRLHASMREAAVTSALYLRAVQAHASAHMMQQGQRPPGQEAGPLRMPPMLFMVVTSNTAEHNGATLTLEYRVFQADYLSVSHLQQAMVSATAAADQPRVPVCMQAVELSVENLAEGLGHHKLYGSFQPIPLPLPGGTSPLLAGSSGGGAAPAAGSPQLQESLKLAAAAAGQQVAALEAHYQDLLKHLSMLSKEAYEEAGATAAVQAENARLFKELEQLRASS